MAGSVITVTNEKGGVGKTTMSVQIALELAERKLKVLIIDNDPSGDATTVLFGSNIPPAISHGSKPEAVSNCVKLYTEGAEFHPFHYAEFLHVIGASDQLTMFNGGELEPAYTFADNVQILTETYDIIIIDCLPSFGLLFTSAVLASGTGGLLIPLELEDLPVNAAKKVVQRLASINKRLSPASSFKVVGVLANKVSNPLSNSAKYYLSHLESFFGDSLLKTRINRTVQVADAIACQQKVGAGEKKKSKVAQQIVDLASELLKRLEALNNG